MVLLATVRQKVKELSEFVRDDEKLREERKKAKKNRDKYVGMSGLSASMHYGKSSSGARFSKDLEIYHMIIIRLS